MALSFPLGLSFPICKVSAGGLSVFHCLRTESPNTGVLIKRVSCEVNQSFRMSKAPSVFRIVTQQSCYSRSSMAEGRILGNGHGKEAA